MRTDVRPSPRGVPTKVKIGILVADITRVNDVDQSIEVDLFVKRQWRDPRLTGLSGCSFPRTAIWFPLVSLLNSNELSRKYKRQSDQVDVHDHGEVTHLQRFDGPISTYHHLQRFPFDRHRFQLRLAVFEYSARELSLVVDKDFTRAANLLNIADWTIHSVSGSVANKFVEEFNKTFSLLTVEIDLSRNATYYIGKVLVPLTLIVMMSWVVFWIDPEKFGPQIGLSVTAMLTLIAFQFTLTTELPKLSYFTTLDMLILGSTILVFLSLVEATLAARLVALGRKEFALRLDRVCRWLFPTAFVLFWLVVLA